jgi:dihydrofolate reductase
MVHTHGTVTTGATSNVTRLVRVGKDKHMGRVIVVQYITLDGIVSDPDGSQGSPTGGWVYRYGPEAVAGDKFQLGPSLDTGVLLFGRSTWDVFSQRWPARTGDFAQKMNAAAKLVASRTMTDVSAWNNSTVIDGDLMARVDEERSRRDVIVIGSVTIVRALAATSRVDEYRLLTLPTMLGEGERLFATSSMPTYLRCVDASLAGAGVLTRLVTEPEPARTAPTI